jgi:hypothetical protein
VHLKKKPTATDAGTMAKLDHAVIRPSQPNFDPSMTMKWLQAVETHVLENADGTHHDRLQAAMMHVRLNCLPKKEKKHKHWHKPCALVLNPHFRRRSACVGNWNKQQGRSALLATEAKKQGAVRACGQQTRKRRALHVAQEALAVEKDMNSNWTKPAWEKLMQFR